MIARQGGAAVTSPISAEGAEDIAITGNGTFDGAGETWRPVKKEKMTPARWNALLASGGVVSADGKIRRPTREAMNGDSFLRSRRQKTDAYRQLLPPRPRFPRPVLLTLVNCKHILIKYVLPRISPKYILYPESLLRSDDGSRPRL